MDRDYLDQLCRGLRLPWTEIPGTKITGSRITLLLLQRRLCFCPCQYFYYVFPPFFQIPTMTYGGSEVGFFSVFAHLISQTPRALCSNI